MKKLLGLDLGGSSIKYGLYSESGEHLGEGGVVDLNATSTDTILEQIDTIKTGCSRVDGIGISLPGKIDKHTGLITHGGAIKTLDGVDLRGIIQNKYNIDTVIENDANCAALAEYWLGAGKGCETIVVMVVGTGIGGGLVINGKLHHGSHSFSGELGTTVFGSEVKPEIKYYGMASTSNLVRRAALIDQKVTNGREFFANLTNPALQELYDQWITELAIGIYNTAMILDPCKYLIGGGISAQKDIYPAIKKVINEITYYPNDLIIEPCRFGNEAGQIGAVYKLLYE